MLKKRNAAVILAAGQGRRMNCDTAKQYLELKNRPVLYYAIKAFEESSIDDIVLVTGEAETEFCRKEIVERYGFSKVRKIVAGGRERYHSVARGLEALAADGCLAEDAAPETAGRQEAEGWQEPGIVMIHDGARPFVTKELIDGLLAETVKYPACVTGTPVKDTIKIVDGENACVDTPDRARVWAVQTPQAFDYRLVLSSYRQVLAKESELLSQGITITDDAMVVELCGDRKVHLIMGDYLNRKLTTPDDLLLAEPILDILATKYGEISRK